MTQLTESQIENRKLKIIIVGAGPAGTSLAIRLAKENFKVCLIERERFPRQKLCGEFISPECLKHFRELDVLGKMLAAGGGRIAETVFYAPNGSSVGVPSEWFNKNEAGALSLSRSEMDFQLMERAKAIGVEVLEEHSVVGLLNEKNRISGVKLRTKDSDIKEFFADLIIDAAGRAAVLSKLAEKEISRQDAKLQIKKIPNPKSRISNRFVGFKAHLKNVNLENNVCEIYFFPGGYGGLSRVENDLANFCFLIRAETVRKFSSDAEQIIEKVVFQNNRAAEVLKNVELGCDWLAVSVDGFGRKNLNPTRNVFGVGDAGAFIDPFTGSGMLMAFESAEILAKAITENSSAEKIAEQYKTEYARKFQKRLFVCSLLRRAAFAPMLAKVLIPALSIGDLPRKLLARATRQREANG